MALQPGNKLRGVSVQGEDVTYGYMYWCPGCDSPHVVYVKSHTKYKWPVWGFNGNTDHPTFTPSVLVHETEVTPRCHVFVTDGRIHFLDDCTHVLKGQVVDLPDWPAEWN